MSSSLYGNAIISETLLQVSISRMMALWMKGRTRYGADACLNGEEDSGGACP